MSTTTTKNLAQVFSNLVKKKSKGDNLLDICFSLPNRGIGRKITKKGWVEPNTYWTITRNKFGTLSNSALRGQAYGVLTWAGKTDSKERPILDLYSKNWSIYPTLKFSSILSEEEQQPNIEEEEQQPNVETTEGEQQQQN